MNAEYTGKKIAELRKEKNLTQKELADKLHVTDKAVSKWERGVNFPDLGLMEEIAKELDTTPSILLGLENSTKEEIVTSFAEISGQQSEEALKDIQQIGWINLFAGIVLFIFVEQQGLSWLINGLLGAIVGVAIYTLRKYKAIKKFELLDAVLAEIMVMDGFVFLLIQLVTGSNPIHFVSAILIAVAVVCVQLLFYRVMKPQWMKLLPLVVSVGWLAWGVLLEVAEPVWVKDSIWSLIIYSILPTVSCFITWFICRKKDTEKARLSSSLKPFAIVFVTALILVGLLGQDLLAKTYVKVFHKHLENYAEKLLEECHDTTSDQYGFWKVTCYPEDDLVEFHTGGAGLVANSTYYGFYYSPDNSHKTFQGADIPLNVNEDLADWYGEGDNWGKSTRLIDKWFWFEANF